MQLRSIIRGLTERASVSTLRRPPFLLSPLVNTVSRAYCYRIQNMGSYINDW